MKNPTITLLTITAILTILISCASGVSAQDNSIPARDSGAVFADLEGKEWLLSGITRSGQTVHLDRNAIGMAGAYTISFQDNRVSGMGAPNRYFGPFSTGPGRALSIGNIASTLMAAIFEPEALKEHEFFAYLARISHWDLRDGSLELHSSDNDESLVVLTFKEN